MYMKRYLLKFDCLFCIVLVCSEPQEVFKSVEYLKSLFYNHILKCYSNKINQTKCNRSIKPNATAYIQCAKDGVKMLSNTLEPDILQKNICFYAGNMTRV